MKKRFMAVVAGVVTLCCLVAFVVWSIRCDDAKPDETIMIAHAGGSIGGHVQTNVLEAVNRALDHGFTHIEPDLILTADSVLVACHDWNTYNEYAGRPDGTPPPRLRSLRLLRFSANILPSQPK